MFGFVKRVWNDIGRGENIDAYATIVAALILSILNVLGFAPPDSIPAITLAVLALLAIGVLVSRYRVEDLAEGLSSLRGFFVDEFDNQTFNNDLENAHEVWLYGASLDGVASEYYALFERKLRSGGTIRVMVIDPNDERVLELSEMRAYANPSVQRAKAKAMATLSDFCELRKLAPNNLQIRILRFPITHRLIALNPGTPDGKLYISNYPFGTPGGSLPKLVLSAKDGRWYDLYKTEAENLWDAATDWACP